MQHVPRPSSPTPAEVTVIGPLSLETLSAKLDLSITRSEVAAGHAERAALAAERTEKAIGLMSDALKRIANDHASLRHGVPASWAGRFALVGFAAMCGVMATLAIGAVTTSCRAASPAPAVSSVR